MLSLFAACLLACAPVAGDSVIVTVTVTDNAVQPVAVDSVQVGVVLSSIGGSEQTVTLAKASPTVARFAYPLSLWSPGQSHGGPVSVRLGRVCATGMCWSEWKTAGSSGAWAWSYTLDTTAPNAPEDGTFSIGVSLN